MEADADGTLRRPLPAELRHGKIEVAAMLKAANGISSAVLRATPGMLQRRQCVMMDCLSQWRQQVL